jgi:hypothetical protein
VTSPRHAAATPVVSRLGSTPRRRLELFGYLVATILFAGACGGNSPAAPGPPPTPAPPRVAFIADNDNPEVEAISLQAGGGATAERFTLSLRADEVTDLYGYGVDIVFDPALVAFESAAAGGFFDETGVSVATQVTEGPTGTLVIGQSRVGEVAGVTGSGILLSLEFVAVTPGSGAIEVRNGGAFDSTGATAGIEFYGGLVTVPAATNQ